MPVLYFAGLWSVVQYTFSGLGTIVLVYMFRSQMNTHNPTEICLFAPLWMELPPGYFGD